MENNIYDADLTEGLGMSADLGSQFGYAPSINKDDNFNEGTVMFSHFDSDCFKDGKAPISKATESMLDTALEMYFESDGSGFE